jgi:hypothetical protein
MTDDFIIVTNWEEVEADDFYLTDKWLMDNCGKTKKEAKELRQMARNKDLSIGYIVGAKNYCIYSQMDAQQVFINNDCDVLVDCEGCVIDNEHKHKEEYNY